MVMELSNDSATIYAAFNPNNRTMLGSTHDYLNQDIISRKKKGSGQPNSTGPQLSLNAVPVLNATISLCTACSGSQCCYLREREREIDF